MKSAKNKSSSNDNDFMKLNVREIDSEGIIESKNTEFTQQIKVKFNKRLAINETTSNTSFMNADEESEFEILLQFETRPISHDQLIVELKEIYVELLMMKVKCIDVDKFMKAQEKNSSRQQ